jgi:pimeloyl-ACP methyl ester carboxylesterase
MPRRSGHDAFPIAVEGAAEGVPDLLLVHANGFCKELWRPIADRVSVTAPGVSWLSMDLRGHGESGPISPPCPWHPLALDILAVLGEGVSGVVGVGHSMGGASLARAEILHPGTFRALILVEPILFPPPHGRADIPLAEVAGNRRRVFPDREAARLRFASGGPFAAWDPEVLDLYVDHAWGPGPEGWTIRCEPGVEADYYREGNNVDTWDRLHELDLPVVLVVGETSDTHRGAYLDRLIDRFRDVELVVIEGAGHLVPMERPTVIAELVVERLTP